MKKLEKDFLKTEFGAELKMTVKALDYHITKKSEINQFQDQDAFAAIQKDIGILFAQLDIYKLALRQFYGLDVSFTRTNDYYGLVANDETMWIVREERKE